MFPTSLENNEINEKKIKKSHGREIWCSDQETRGFYEKLGDCQENRESWQVY